MVGIYKILLLPIYRLLYKTKYKGKNIYSKRQALYQTISKYFAYSFLIIIILLTAWHQVIAKNNTPENFGKNTLIFSLTNSGEDFQENEEIIEGPIINQDEIVESYLKYEALSEDDYRIEPNVSDGWQGDLAILTPDGSAIEVPNIGDPSMIQTKRKEIIEYTVAPGDVLSTIAQKFDLSVVTLLWTNDLSLYSIIKPGQKLKILPTDGLIYKVQKGDNLDSIAKKYQTNIDKVLEYNKLASANDLKIGQELLLPGGIKPAVYTPATPRPVASVFNKPIDQPIAKESGGKLLWPTSVKKITQYYGWRHTGLDIGNKVGEPIYASESGKVEVAGWNTGGYGYYVIVNHGNGLKTLYAHASKLYVAKGDTVSRGDVIAAIGSTGRSTGPHIHFEVRIDEKRVNPLDYIK